MQAKVAERVRARGLRLEGKTYDEIAQALVVSKSSVSLWTRDLPKPHREQDDISPRMAGLRRHFELRRTRVAAERAAERQCWSEKMGPLSERELLIAGTVAYWAEGTKAKPWRPEEKVVFVNSDPNMIRLFHEFLATVGVSDDRLRLQVAIHESADVATAEVYWAAVMSIPVSDFLRTTLKRHSVTTNRKNIGVSYHGCLSIRVLQGAVLYRRIEGMWAAISDAHL